jgi:hypothetical protein
MAFKDDLVNNFIIVQALQLIQNSVDNAQDVL